MLCVLWEPFIDIPVAVIQQNGHQEVMPLSMLIFEALGNLKATSTLRVPSQVASHLQKALRSAKKYSGVDAYDIIEFIAALDWCTGSVTMAGNSWVATTQWVAAIQKPPSLKCIAPWEGFTDKYRDVVYRGAIPKRDFVSFIFDKTIRGRQKREDLAKALDQWPLMNAYWEDKALDTSVIDIPIYVLASYCSGIHVPGSIRGFNSAKTKDKWLRIHLVQEWFDLYRKESIDDLQKFFDRYVKGLDNGWEKTSPV